MKTLFPFVFLIFILTSTLFNSEVDGRNVALKSCGATATAISEGTYLGDTQYANEAIDGDINNGWSSNWDMPAWLKVQFDQVYIVSKIGIWWGSHQHTFSVSLSEDGTNWTMVISPRLSNNTEGSAPVFEEFPITPTKSRYVKVDITTTSAPSSHIFQASIRELEAYGIPIQEIQTEEIVTDIDGNSYNTVKIGTQVWMKENLKTTHYADGTSLVNGTGAGDLSGDYTTKYWFAYGDNMENKNTYGLLYSWAAAMNGASSSDANPSGVQGVCPDGWHLPSDAEWKQLEMYLGMRQAEADAIDWRGTDEGGKMKETGITHWASPNTGATNSSGFTALPGGTRAFAGPFFNIGNLAYLWSSTDDGNISTLIRALHYKKSSVVRDATNKANGYSVRCIKDEEDYYSLTIQDAIVNKGDTVEISITTSELTSEDNIISCQFDINYDTEVLEYTGNTIVGTIAEGGTVLVNTNTAGKLSIGYMGTNAIIGAGDILKLRFKALKVDTITLTMTDAYLNDNLVDNITNGAVIILDIIPLKYGDVDDDGKILAFDAALTLQYSVGLDPLPDKDPLPWENWREITANVDGEGVVTANDASEILKYSIGLITEFPVESGIKSNADIGITVENNNIVFKSNGELFGLNVFVNENKEYLGAPVFLNKALLTATNITPTTYAIGVCTEKPLKDGTEFMIIPFNVTSSKYLTFDLIVNTVEKQVTVDLITGMVGVNDKDFDIYPNPANTKLFINALSQDAKIVIYDINGRLVLEKQIINNQVDISKLDGGIYLVKIYSGNNVITKKLVKE